MQFGICGDPSIGKRAAAAGYDYFEWSVPGLLHPLEDADVFHTALAEARAVGLPCPVVNVFVPASHKITGPARDLAVLESYVHTVLQRAETAGVEAIVFGSGGARAVPDGFARENAWQQLVEFCLMTGPIAQQHGVTIVIEPLNTGECNILNTVAESALLVRAVDHPNIRLLVDGYHWAKDGDTLEGIVENASLLHHAHVAAVQGRRPPDDADPCGPFFDALRQAGYDGRVSFEGSLTDPAWELPAALRIMRQQIR